MNIKENMEYLGLSYYLCRSQAGLERAVNHYKAVGDLSTSRLKQPTEYPVFVSLSSLYDANEDQHFVVANFLYAANLQGILNKMGQ